MKFFFTFLFSLLLMEVCFAQDLNLGLVAYYKLDGNALDAGPNGLNGTMTNVSPIANSAGVANKAMSFTNTIGPGGPAPTSWITLPTSPLLQLTGDKTFSFWIKPHTDQSLDGYNEWLYNYAVCGDMFIYHADGSGTIYADYGCGGGSEFSVSGYTPGTWQQVVISESSSGQVRLYKNGILMGSGLNTSSSKTYSGTPYIGRSLNTVLGFRGALDQFRIYNRILTQVEITLLSNENNAVATIASFMPDNGYTGTLVSITGTNFTGATSVTIGGTNVASFTVNDDSHITSIVGAGITGSVSVTTSGGTGSSANSFTYNGYITANDGDWSDGATWVGGNVPPDGASVIINHNVTMDISPTVNRGDSMIINGNLVCGYNIVSGTGSVTINGLVKTINGAGFSGASNASFSNTLSSVTLNSSSTIEYAGFGNTIITPINYANLISSGFGGRILPEGKIGISGIFTPGSNAWTTLGASSTVEFNGTDPQDIPAIPYDNLSLSNIGIKNLSNTADSTVVDGNLTIGPGSALNAFGSLRVKGNWINDGYYSNNNSFVFFNGAISQTITGTYPSIFKNIFVSNEAGIYLNKNIRITTGGILTFGNEGTKIHTGTNRVVMEAGAIDNIDNNPTTYIHGNLQILLSSSDSYTTKYFKIGDATTYCPVTIDFLDVNGSQDIVISPSESGDHPNIGTSALNANRSVNRYWKLTNDYSLTFAGTYDVTFEFSSADVDAGANPANLKIGMYSEGAWTYPNTVYIDATHIKATGISGFGDFAIAELDCTPSVSISIPSSTICSNDVATFTATPINGGSDPIYYFKKNGFVFQSGSSKVFDIVNLQSGDVITCDMKSNASCAPTETVTSNSITTTVNYSATYYQDADGDGFGNPNISIQSCTQPQGYVTDNTDCDDTKLLYADNDGDGYGAGAPVACGVTDNTDCDDNDPNVYPNLPAVNIDGDFIPSMGICEGLLTTFTATPVYGGTAPSYQWKKNNINVGTNSNTYTDATLADADVITCELTSNAACALSTMALSNSIFTSVHPLPVVSAGMYSTYTTNDPPFALNGTPVGGSFSGTGVTGAGDMFDPSVAGPGDHTITYYYAGGNNGGCGNSATATIHVTTYTACTLAPMLGNIIGSTTACGIAGTTTSASYSIDNIGGATYVWTKSSSLIQIISGQNTNNINATFSSNFSSGTITVTVSNACGNTARVISISKKTPATPGTISGITNPCAFIGTPVTYSIRKVAGAMSYIWTVPDGVSIAGGTSPYTTMDTSINVTFPSSFTSNSIGVSGSNACGISTARTLSIANKLPGTPGAINGSTDVCEFIGANANVTYTINKVINATSYQWIIPDGVNIISTNINDTSIVLNFPDTYTTGAIQVKAKSGCGDGGYRTLAVTKKLPGTPGIISGPIDVCELIGTNVTYTINKVASATSYEWQIPDGVNIISTDVSDTSIVLNFTDAYVTGAIKVKAKRGCGDGAYRSLTITKKLPATPGVITATGDICSSMYTGTNTVTYTIPANTNAPLPSSYVWVLVPTVNGSSAIVGGDGVIDNVPGLTVETSGLSIQIQFYGSYTGGTLSVVAKRSCGTSAARKLTLTKNVPPTPSLSVLTGTICSGATSSVFYTASGQANTDYYIWSSPAGTKIEGSETKTPTKDTTTYNTIVIDYPANFTSGNLTVKGKSICGTSAVATLAVSSQPCSMLSKNIQGDVEISQEQSSAVLYPNPNDGDFMLKIKSANRTANAQIEITDITGRPVGKYTISNSNGNMLLHVNNKSFAAGPYILKYKIGNEIKFLKFIIEK